MVRRTGGWLYGQILGGVLTVIGGVFAYTNTREEVRECDPKNVKASIIPNNRSKSEIEGLLMAGGGIALALFSRYERDSKMKRLLRPRYDVRDTL